MTTSKKNTIASTGGGEVGGRTFNQNLTRIAVNLVDGQICVAFHGGGEYMFAHLPVADAEFLVIALERALGKVPCEEF